MNAALLLALAGLLVSNFASRQDDEAMYWPIMSLFFVLLLFILLLIKGVSALMGAGA